MKKYVGLPIKRKKNFCNIPKWCLGIGSISGSPEGKRVHLRYVQNAPREQAALVCCAAACILNAGLLREEAVQMGKEFIQNRLSGGRKR